MRDEKGASGVDGEGERGLISPEREGRRRVQDESAEGEEKGAGGIQGREEEGNARPTEMRGRGGGLRAQRERLTN